MIQKLERMQFLLVQLESVVGEECLSLELKEILSEINPMLRIAVMGEVSSGKSSLIGSILHEGGMDHFTSVSSSNETSVPTYIRYAETPYIRLQYFTAKIIQDIDFKIQRLSGDGEANKSDIALLEQVRNNLVQSKKVFSVADKSKLLGIIDEISLKGKDKRYIFNKLQEFSGSSSGNKELDAISKIWFGYNNEFLKKTKNIEFIDSVGCGEPNPVTAIKFENLLNDEDIDIIVFVFSDIAVRNSFTDLFNNKSTNRLAEEGRLVIILNKLDLLSDKRYKVSQKPFLIESFKDTLVKHCPVIKNSVEKIDYFTLSLHAIEDKLKGKWLKKESDALKEFSIEELRRIRKYFVDSQYHIKKQEKRISAFQGQLQSLFQFFGILDEDTETKVREAKKFTDVFDKLIPQMEDVDNELKRKKDSQKGYLKLIENECRDFLRKIDWKRYSKSAVFQCLGEPKSLFREVRDYAITLIKKLYDDEISKLYGIIMEKIDNQVEMAFEEYAKSQDKLIQNNLHKAIGLDDATIANTQPFYVSLKGQRDLFNLTVQNPIAESNRKRQFGEFSNIYLSKKCSWDTPRNAETDFLRDQISLNLERCCEEYVDSYFLGKGSFSEFWSESEFLSGKAKKHLLHINKVLERHLKLYQNARKLYTSQLYIQTNRDKIISYSKELMELSKEVSSRFTKQS